MVGHSGRGAHACCAVDEGRLADGEAHRHGSDSSAFDTKVTRNCCRRGGGVYIEKEEQWALDEPRTIERRRFCPPERPVLN